MNIMISNRKKIVIRFSGYPLTEIGQAMLPNYLGALMRSVGYDPMITYGFADMGEFAFVRDVDVVSFVNKVRKENADKQRQTQTR